MPIRRALVILLALVVIAVTGPARAGVGRPLLERRLSNGLRLIVAPDPAGVDVSVVVRYDTGARDEPRGLAGLAHLVEHVLFFGARHVEPGGFARLLEQAGASNMNGTTSQDATSYFETVPPERLPLALWLESERMGYGLDRFDEAGLARARAEVLNERRERISEVPLGAVAGHIFGALFPSYHPYAHLPAGTATSIGNITVADVRAFVHTWYGPGNATVVISGKVDPLAASALVDRYFGTLPPRAPPVRPTVPQPTATAATVLGVKAAVNRREIRLAWVTPRFGAPGDVELDLAAAILVDRGAGWLEHTLLASPRLCTQVSAHQASQAMASIFEIRAVVADGRSSRDALVGILRALRRFEHGVTDDEIQRARLVFQRGRLFGLESSMGLAQQVASVAQLGPVPPVYDGNLARYAAITPTAVREAVRTFLGFKPWVIALAEPTRTSILEGEVSSISEAAW